MITNLFILAFAPFLLGMSLYTLFFTTVLIAPSIEKAITRSIQDIKTEIELIRKYPIENIAYNASILFFGNIIFLLINTILFKIFGMAFLPSDINISIPIIHLG